MSLLQQIRAKLGWLGLGLFAAGVAVRLWRAGQPVGVALIVAGLGIVVLYAGLQAREIAARVADWWARARSFLAQVRNEIERVTWPSRREVSATTVVVILTSIFFGVYLWGIDLALSRVVRWIFRMLGAA